MKKHQDIYSQLSDDIDNYGWSVLKLLASIVAVAAVIVFVVSAITWGLDDTYAKTRGLERPNYIEWCVDAWTK